VTLESTNCDESESSRGRRLLHLAETDRLETFSDGVFAIVVTLLVLDLKDPPHGEGQLLEALLRQWPAYLAYFASFAYVAVIWLNHHHTFVGIQRANRGLHFANFSMLFTTALIPFPTAVLSHTFIGGVDSRDAHAAVGLYAGVATAMCASWLLLYQEVHRHRDRLVEEEVNREMFGSERTRATIGVLTYSTAGLLGALWLPAIALIVFVAMPIFYWLTSEGLKAGKAKR
jgi:TMEM175 potassium channel family protein